MLFPSNRVPNKWLLTYICWLEGLFRAPSAVRMEGNDDFRKPESTLAVVLTSVFTDLVCVFRPNGVPTADGPSTIILPDLPSSRTSLSTRGFVVRL